jgi:hypothetical protein
MCSRCNPCLPDCAKRSPTCHGQCDKYIKWAEANMAENEARHALKYTGYETFGKHKTLKLMRRTMSAMAR